MEEIQMTTINLKDFYAWYTHDEYIEVSDEVAAELKVDKLYEAAHQRRTTRNKAQYSLNCDDGIEYSACLHEPTPQELLDRMELFVHLWNALNSLPEVQGVRVEAHLILGKSYRQIAREQGVDKSVVRRSVKRGMLIFPFPVDHQIKDIARVRSDGVKLFFPIRTADVVLYRSGAFRGKCTFRDRRSIFLLSGTVI